MRNQIVWATIAAIIIIVLAIVPSATKLLTGATPHEDGICGNNISENDEECDGPDSIICDLCSEENLNEANYERCLVKSCLPDCTCASNVCGNLILEEDEECEYSADEACPDFCTSDCTCTQYAPSAISTSFFFTSIHEHETITEEFSSSKVPITKFSFTAGDIKIETNEDEFVNHVSNVRISLEPNATAERAFKEDYEIYQLFEIKHEGLEEEQIANATLYFRVSEKWFKEKNIDKFSIKLFRSVPSWQILQTQLTEEGSDYTYYKAQSPGLSVFLIGGKEQAVTPIPVLAPDCGNGVVEPGEDSGNCCIDTGCANDLTCVSNKCKLVVLCGNNVCEQTETLINCPQDCTKTVLFSPTMLIVWTMAIIIIFLIALNIKKGKEGKKREPLMQRFATGYELRDFSQR